MLSAPARKLVLAIHIAVSVGWIGALLAYLALDLVASTGDDAAQVRSAFVAMDVVTRTAIVPLAFAAVATGVLVALGTKWGLFRHYWVVVSLVATSLALAVLLVETRTIAHHAALASDASASDAEVLALPGTLPHSIGGLLVLTFVLVLNFYKPRGLTPYGWRKGSR